MSKLRYALAAALPLLAAASAVSADTVTFSVVSYKFGSAALNTSAVYASGNGTATVSFTPTAGNVFNGSLNDGQSTPLVTFGTFGAVGTGTSNINISDTFTLTLLLSAPPGGNGSTTATVTGQLKNGDAGKDLVINLPAFTLPNVLPNVSFAFNGVTLSEFSNATVNESSQALKGTGTYHALDIGTPTPGPGVVPLPASSLGGLALVGLTAASRLRRRTAQL